MIGIFWRSVRFDPAVQGDRLGQTDFASPIQRHLGERTPVLLDHDGRDPGDASAAMSIGSSR